MAEPRKTKVCSRCHQEKGIDEFSLRRRAKDGHDSQCKDCHNTPTHPVELPEDLSTVFKICSRCDTKKVLTEFFHNRAANDGHMSRCKACFNTAEARPARVAKRKAYKAAYHVLHAETINARSIQWAKDNPERFRSRQNKWKNDHKAQVLAAAAVYRANNRALCRLRSQRSRRKKPVYYALKRKIWRILNRNKIAEYQHKRRAREQSIPYVEEVDIAVLFVRDKGICSICHKRVRRFKDGSIKDGSRDHIIPVTMPGSEHSYRNMALAHTWCNSSKGNRSVPQQMRLF